MTEPKKKKKATDAAVGSGPNVGPKDSPTDGPSLRSWLADLAAADQLRRVGAEVDWDEEIGALARINLGMAGPALLFENIKDYKDGRCTQFITCGLSNTEQVCLLLGLSPGTGEKAIVRHLKDTYRQPIEPVIVESGPVKENILRDGDIDLWEFPAPKWHATDGGRYFDTFCGVVTHDPATNRPNIGLYRGMVLDKAKIGKLLIVTQGWGDHFSKHRGAPSPSAMPVAIAHGWHDVMPFCAGSPFPKHVCEWDMMGAILGRPVELVQCETVDLQVPASAEIVVEGYIDPDPETFEMEGPFAEYPGYLNTKASPKPVLQVTCITHRDQPILRGALEGARPGFPSEDSPLCAYSWSAIAWNMLEDSGVAGVTDVWMPPVSTGINIVVQIHKQYRGHAQQVASALWGTSSAQWFFKNVIVVEEDIDIRDPVALEWAFAFRVNAGRNDVMPFGPTFGSPLDPSTPFGDADPAKYGSAKWTRLVIDATRSWEFEPNPHYDGQRFPRINTIDPVLEKKIRERWAEYGIAEDYLSDEQRENLTLEQMAKILPEV